MASVNDNRSFWDRWAALYGPIMRGNVRVYRVLSDFVRPYIDDDMDVLELACGSGQITEHLYRSARAYTATDFSQNMIDRAQKRLSAPNLRFLQADATRLDMPDDSFDIVIIANALHIMPEPARALKEIRRVMRDGALLYAPTFVYEPTGHTGKIRVMESAGFKTFNKWSADAFIDYLENQGFEVLQRAIISANPMPECAVLLK